MYHPAAGVRAESVTSGWVRAWWADAENSPTSPVGGDDLMSKRGT